ncbi:MAG: beta-galactosidase [Chitinophagaceae bacterium]|nr:MAG: beta-galactosidase [Chitinophagaceae bacterium]
MKYLLFFYCFLIATLPVFAQKSSGRETILLDKDWQFYKGSIHKNTDTAALSWKEMNIPHTWNNIDMQQDTTYYEGDSWYKKIIYLGDEYKDKRLFLRFSGVGNIADIYVNGRFIGEHQGGYSAFCFEITDAVHLGKPNVIMVKANNQIRPDVIPINNHLFANYGGIYRKVHLIVTGELNISTLDYASPGVYISQDNVSKNSADISVKVELENKYDDPQKVDVKAILDNEKGAFVQSSAIESEVSPQGITTVEIPIPVLHPHLWNGREDPYLYSVKVEITQGDKLLDEVTQPLGIRSFHIEPGKGFYLNEKPYRLYGVCRHQDWWGYGNALTGSMQRVDMGMIDDIGATSVRFAHYQQADIIYFLCDSLGILAWAEIPFVNAWSGKEGPNAKQQLTELIKQNYNHPSIFVWGLHNEVYCKYPTDYPARLTYELNDLAKTLDSYRYTVSTTGYGKMHLPMNLMADIQAMNRYYGWYEGKISDMEKWVDGLEKDYPDYNVVLSEYGAGGNIDQQAYEPERPADVIKGQFFPEEYETELHVEEWPVIEKHPYIAASYVWNMFDFCVPGGWSRGGVLNRNLKGLVTFDRKIKKDAFYWYKANWSKEPVIHIAGRRLQKRMQRENRIEVFSNLQNVKLWLNGRLQPPPVQGTNDKDFIWPRCKFRLC